MKPLTLDLSVFERFGFENPPVGVKFLFDRPEGIERLDKKLFLCGMAAEAFKREAPFYADMENQACPPSVHVLGHKLPPAVEGGNLGVELKIFKDAYANRRALAAAPTFAEGTVNYLVFAPLRKLTFSPDLLVILADNVGQTEVLLRSLAYSTGKVLVSRSTNILACSWLYAYPYLSGELNYLTTGLGFGMRISKPFPEGKQLVSIPYDQLVVITHNLEEMEWVPPSYSGKDPDFDRRLFERFFGLVPEA